MVSMKKLLATLAFMTATIAGPTVYANAPANVETPPAVTEVCFTALEGLVALNTSGGVTMFSFPAEVFFANIGPHRPDIHTMVVYVNGEQALTAAFDDSGCWIEDLPPIPTTVDELISDLGLVIASN